MNPLHTCGTESEPVLDNDGKQLVVSGKHVWYCVECDSSFGERARFSGGFEGDREDGKSAAAGE